MPSFLKGWGTQVRVVKALMIRELITRFGRENIGFLWIVSEPLLFAVLVGILWRVMKGPTDFGVSIFAFVATGYLPIVMFRAGMSRAVHCLSANGGLMYHRQIKILDLILVRFFVELLGHMVAYLFIALALGGLGLFPLPYDVGFLILGGAYWSLFTLSVMLVVAPLSELSEVLEKIMPVTTYIIVPLSGAFFLVGFLSPHVATALLYSPPVHAMEMMRFGVFGPSINPQFDFVYPLYFCLPCMAIGLFLCRFVRRRLVVE